VQIHSQKAKEGNVDVIGFSALIRLALAKPGIIEGSATL